MLPDDDVLVTRWQRLHRKVMGLSLDGLLRWALVANATLVTVGIVMGLVAWIGGGLAMLVTLIAGLF